MLAQSTQSGAKLPVDDGRPRSVDFPGTAKKSPHKQILVVDDESLVRWSVAETLEADGYEVTEAGDGVSAIGRFSNLANRVDLVLLDLRLPDSGDLRLLSAMRRLSPTTPIILMTAYCTPEVRAEAESLGAFTVLSKPFEMDDLPPLVERALAARPS